MSSYRNMDARRTREADRRRTREGLKVSHALPALSSSVTESNSSAAVANECVRKREVHWVKLTCNILTIIASNTWKK